MNKSTHLIIVPTDSDIEDAFSSTYSPDYIPASPDYFPASPGNTSSDPSKDLSKYLLASLAILPFYDDPYMKVMQAYNATINKSLIPPQAPIAPPTKRARFLSSSSISTLPQVYEIGKFSHKTSLERHEEQIETILNYLDELPLERIEMAPKRTSTSAAPTMNQAAIRKLVADSVATALETQAATMTNTDNTNKNTKQIETHVARKYSYKEFMSCQPFNFKGT
nr:hypothetical protein [Tanacetum cinerariifolium]